MCVCTLRIGTWTVPLWNKDCVRGTAILKPLGVENFAVPYPYFKFACDHHAGPLLPQPIWAVCIDTCTQLIAGPGLEWEQLAVMNCLSRLTMLDLGLGPSTSNSYNESHEWLLFDVATLPRLEQLTLRQLAVRPRSLSVLSELTTLRLLYVISSVRRISAVCHKSRPYSSARLHISL